MLLSFPSITLSEFSQACSALEVRCHDRLDGTDWASVELKDDCLSIKKEISPPESSSQRLQNDPVEEMGVEELDEDQTVLQRTPHYGNRSIIVDFSIVLSSTYQVPVLWFTLPQSLPAGIEGLEAVYRYLVPQRSQEMLRQIGVIGGISIAHHPLSGVPAFFVHPCNTPDALQSLSNGESLSSEQYLYLWLGLVGPSLGLHVPSKLLCKYES